MTTTSDKRAYILMEVIISIMILSVVGISLLEVSSNEKKLYVISASKLEFLKYASIPLDQHSINLHRKNLNMYDLLKSKYDFKNDFLIKKLKNIEISYKQTYKSMVDFTQDKTSINLLIDEIVLQNKSATSKFFTVKQ